MADRSIQPEHLDHPPSPEELAEIYMRSGENDPRSLFYKRVLDRPKVPVGRLLLQVLTLLAAGAIGYFFGAWAFSPVWGVICIPLCVVAAGLLLAKPLLTDLIKTYQALAPTKVRMRCRYEPSCSVYMLRAVEKYGAAKGFAMGMKRWRGCKPPNGGFDPI